MCSNEIAIGDYIIYSTKGICQVSDIEQKRFDYEVKDYFVFVPVFDKNSVYYVPTDFNSIRINIKPVLSPNEAEELIKYSQNAEPAQWIANPAMRKKDFENTIKQGTREEIIQIIKAIKIQETKQKDLGRQLYAIDSRILKNCIKLICGELAYIKDTTIDDMSEKLGY